MAEELSHTETLLAPSLEEMFGNQFIEAAAVGAEAIVSEATAMAENARSLRTGRVIARNDASALAHAIREAFSNPAGRNERERWRKELGVLFGPETVAAKHRQLYVDLLQGA